MRGMFVQKKILALLCAVVLLVGCGHGAQTENQPVGEDAITFTDDLGRVVSLNTSERVAALTGSFAELWCLAGGDNPLVAAAGDRCTSFSL